MAFTKPTDAEVEELAARVTSHDGITAYQVARVVNEWLAEDGIKWTDKKGVEQTEVQPQRIYSQFANKVPEDQRLGGRFTEEGAEHLAKLVYSTIKRAAKPSKATKGTKTLTAVGKSA